MKRLDWDELLNSYLKQPMIPVADYQLVHCMDLTFLEPDMSSIKCTELKNDALKNHVATVCVYPDALTDFADIPSIYLATVINFPHGQDAIENSLEQIHYAKTCGVSEIDCVFPYTQYLHGNKKEALDFSMQIIETCRKLGLKSKIIIETGVFQDFDQLYLLCLDLIEQSCDFLKTSTGKIAQGASLESSMVLLHAIYKSQKPCGIKISGGIKTRSQAIQYAQLAQNVMRLPINSDWFRLGASSLIKVLNL